MNAVLWIFIAMAFGLMLFVSIQDELPPELEFLKQSSPASERGTTTGAAQQNSASTKTFAYEGWSVRQTGATIEMVKPLEGKLEISGTQFDNPELGILCHAGKLDLRIDTRLAVNGTKTTQVSLGGETSSWSKGTGRNIFPESPRQQLALLAGGRPVEVVISFVDLGKQRLRLDPRGLAQLQAQLPASCRG